MKIASLATIPGRERALKQCVESLLPQVDHLFVYMNGHDIVPEWLMNEPQVFIYGSGWSPPGDIGDAGKFYHMERLDGYHITADDDLIYAPDYVSKMVEAIDRYGLVTLQGRILHRPLKTFYHDREGQTKYRLQDALEEDVQVDIPGTGVMGYHTGAIRFSLDDFPERNMADIWAGLKAMKEGVPIYCIPHTGKEIKLSPYVNHTGPDSIWRRSHRNDAVQTSIANKVFGLKQGVAA